VQFLTEFDAAIRRISSYPKSYILIENELRRCLIKRFPYGILYGIDANAIIIIAVAHLHRKPNYWLARRGEPVRATLKAGSDSCSAGCEAAWRIACRPRPTMLFKYPSTKKPRLF